MRAHDMTRSQINDTFLFQSRVKVKVLGEHIEIGITSKTVGHRPPFSEMIQICVLKKNLF